MGEDLLLTAEKDHWNDFIWFQFLFGLLEKNSVAFPRGSAEELGFHISDLILNIIEEKGSNLNSGFSWSFGQTRLFAQVFHGQSK